ncbi:hypothetical protein [Bdellovibrio reynosensis]|uniref:Uncharacterized protein n=1 Tax=Bdellovibrio reynosensis TaxID=2835041 RepID=A0ABY4C961_9BACT|nr:hypothetical protein [Bdellovibrio reynosensis]UOF00028.1 hypothetical protein MNR06_09975 [Bdellovibrio reynosensis]
MKTLIFAAALLLSLSAQAHDQITTVLSCTQIHSTADNNFDLELQEGGIAGLLRIVIKRYGVGYNSTETHFVRRGISLTCVGCPEVYENKNIQFIYSPLSGLGDLRIKYEAGFVTEELMCAEAVTSQAPAYK